MYTKTYQKISLSIAGIGYGNPPDFNIMGTGFLIHESGLIATNWHVAKALLTKRDDGVVAIRNDACAAFFVSDPAQPDNEFIRGMLAVPVTEIGVPPEPKGSPGEAPLFRGLKPDEVINWGRPDIALLKIDFNRVPSELRNVPPIQKIEPRPLRVGEEVAICGFPQGLNFSAPFKDGESIQLTPLLQIGHISGVLPFDGVPYPSEYVLDIPVNGGSSGSPLFTPDGTVVGIVYATRQSFEPLSIFKPPNEVTKAHDAGVYVPTSLGLAIPSTRFPEEMLRK
jgi:S1-C subfamily serine protease